MATDIMSPTHLYMDSFTRRGLNDFARLTPFVGFSFPCAGKIKNPEGRSPSTNSRLPHAANRALAAPKMVRECPTPPRSTRLKEEQKAGDHHQSPHIRQFEPNPERAISHSVFRPKSGSHSGPSQSFRSILVTFGSIPVTQVYPGHIRVHPGHSGPSWPHSGPSRSFRSILVPFSSFRSSRSFRSKFRSVRSSRSFGLIRPNFHSFGSFRSKSRSHKIHSDPFESTPVIQVYPVHALGSISVIQVYPGSCIRVYPDHSGLPWFMHSGLPRSFRSTLVHAFGSTPVIQVYPGSCIRLYPGHSGLSWFMHSALPRSFGSILVHAFGSTPVIRVYPGSCIRVYPGHSGTQGPPRSGNKPQMTFRSSTWFPEGRSSGHERLLASLRGTSMGNREHNDPRAPQDVQRTLRKSRSKVPRSSRGNGPRPRTTSQRSPQGKRIAKTNLSQSEPSSHGSNPSRGSNPRLRLDSPKPRLIPLADGSKEASSFPPPQIQSQSPSKILSNSSPLPSIRPPLAKAETGQNRRETTRYSGLGTLGASHDHLDPPLRSPTSPTSHRAVVKASVPSRFPETVAAAPSPGSPTRDAQPESCDSHGHFPDSFRRAPRLGEASGVRLCQGDPRPSPCYGGREDPWSTRSSRALFFLKSRDSRMQKTIRNDARDPPKLETGQGGIQPTTLVEVADSSMTSLGVAVGLFVVPKSTLGIVRNYAPS
ncbi:hypothetical protein CRG98_017601 [Punica granatum]|uniref:Uncharacterized protein n=1 Tax=Punica granatum TaxID=22663 RepID=A0A2I0K0C1_PUNGR|nr:hypothetical protein CRG98_017601 [Punica granatum]